MWRAVERIIPDIRERCEVTLVRRRTPLHSVSVSNALMERLRFSKQPLAFMRVRRLPFTDTASWD